MSDTRRWTLRAWWARQDRYERRSIRQNVALAVVILLAIVAVFLAVWLKGEQDNRETRACEAQGGTIIQIDNTLICFAPGVVLST